MQAFPKIILMKYLNLGLWPKYHTQYVVDNPLFYKHIW